MHAEDDNNYLWSTSFFPEKRKQHKKRFLLFVVTQLSFSDPSLKEEEEEEDNDTSSFFYNSGPFPGKETTTKDITVFVVLFLFFRSLKHILIPDPQSKLLRQQIAGTLSSHYCLVYCT
jgi:hypothetical protein